MSDVKYTLVGWTMTVGDLFTIAAKYRIGSDIEVLATFMDEHGDKMKHPAFCALAEQWITTRGVDVSVHPASKVPWRWMFARLGLWAVRREFRLRGMDVFKESL